MNEPTVERRRRNDDRILKILRTLGKIEGRMEEGFQNGNDRLDKVSDRLDRVNGNLARHDGEIKDLQNTDGASAIFEKKVSNWTEWFIKIVLGAIVVALLGVILITK